MKLKETCFLGLYFSPLRYNSFVTLKLPYSSSSGVDVGVGDGVGVGVGTTGVGGGVGEDVGGGVIKVFSTVILVSDVI